LATPEGVGEGQRLENCEDGKERAMYHMETHRKSGESSKSFDQSEASRRESEVAHVRAVLAHITNNVSRVNQVSQKSNVFRANKMTVTTTENMNVQHCSKFAVGHNDQENQLEGFRSSAPVEAIKNPTRPLPGARTRSHAANIPNTSTRAPAEVTVTKPNSKSLPPPPPPSRSAKKEEAPPPARRAKPRATKLTVPKSPFLRSKQRSTVHRQQVTKTTEEIELEKLEKAREEAKALRRRNAKSVAMVLGPQNFSSENREVNGRTKGTRGTVAPKRPITEPKEFEFRTAKRQRVHGMQTRSMMDQGQGIARGTNGARPSPWKSAAQRVAQFTCGRTNAQASGSSSKQQTRRNNAAKKPKLTKPKTPRFATTARQRSSRFKPTEEEELEKAVKEARAMRNRLKQAEAPSSKTGAEPKPNQRQQQQRTSKPIQSKPLTQAEPFSFATDTRAAHRKEKLQQSHQLSRTAAPPPFVFGLSGERRVTRSQATYPSGTAGTVLSNHSLETGPRLRKESSGKVSIADAVETVATKSDEENVPVQVDSFEELLPRRQSNGITHRRKTTFLSGKARRVLRTEDDEDQLKDDGDGDDEEDVRSQDKCAHDANNGHGSLSGLDTEAWRMDEGDGQKDRMQDIIRAGTTLHNPLFRL
jgi:hypothetical protein